MTIDKLTQTVFAMLFACGEPVDAYRLAQAAGCTERETQHALDRLQDALLDGPSPLELIRTENRYQLVTRQEYAPCIRSLLSVRKNSKLSQAALEVLAVVAYHQPATKGFIEQIRGVDSSNILASLLEKDLIQEKGRLELPGRPIAYTTTDHFLRCFSLSSLKDLPPLEQLVSPDQKNP